LQVTVRGQSLAIEVQRDQVPVADVIAIDEVAVVIESAAAPKQSRKPWA